MKFENIFVLMTIVSSAVVNVSKRANTAESSGPMSAEETLERYPDKKVDPKFLKPSSAIIGQEATNLQKRAENAENWECVDGQNYIRIYGKAYWEYVGSYTHEGDHNVTTWENKWESTWEFSRQTVQSFTTKYSVTTSFQISADMGAEFEIFSASTSVEYGLSATMMNIVTSQSSSTETVSKTHTVTLGPYEFAPGESGYIFKKVLKFDGLKIDGAHHKYFSETTKPDDDGFIEDVTMLVPVKSTLSNSGCTYVSKKFRLKQDNFCLEPQFWFNLIHAKSCNDQGNQVFQYYQNESGRGKNAGILQHVLTGYCIARKTNVDQGIINVPGAPGGVAAFFNDCRIDEPEQNFGFAEVIDKESKLIMHDQSKQVFTKQVGGELLQFTSQGNGQANQQWDRDFVN